MEIETLAALIQALGDSGVVVVVLWLLIKEQARHDALIRIIIERTKPTPPTPPNED